MSTYKQLGQAVDSVGNTATEIYSLRAGIRTVSIELECCNVTGSDATVRVYQDDDAESYSVSTSLYYDYPVPADSTVNLKIGPLANPLSHIAVSSSVADAVTFTLQGREIWYGVPISSELGPGRARSFESANTDYLSASHTIGAETTFSMAAWIKISNTAGLARTILGLFSSDLNDAGFFEMQLTTGGVLRAIVEQDNGLGTVNDFGSTDLRDGEWHLVACARNGTNLTVWVDNGTDTPVSETRTFPTIDTIAAGCRVDSVPSAPFEGDIDESSLWLGHLLTDAEASDMYTLGQDSTKRYYINDGKVTITETLTFTNATSYISRASGSWVTDGFEVGDIVTIEGSVSNDGAHPITNVTAADLTVSTTITDESTPVSCTARVGAFGDATVTQPSWLSSLSETLNPGDPGKDEVGLVDLTDNGTADVEGIPAGD